MGVGYKKIFHVPPSYVMRVSADKHAQKPRKTP